MIYNVIIATLRINNLIFHYQKKILLILSLPGILETILVFNYLYSSWILKNTIIEFLIIFSSALYFFQLVLLDYIFASFYAESGRERESLTHLIVQNMTNRWVSHAILQILVLLFFLNFPVF